MYAVILARIMSVPSRIIIGISLAGFISLMIYYNCTNILLVLFTIAITYDVYYLWTKTSTNRFVVLAIFLYMLGFNFLLLKKYTDNPWSTIEIAIIAQLSDVYQYVAGHKFGINKIGWISKNKTYEGYIGGWLLTLLSLVWIYSAYDITVIYLLGIVGGLLSSWIKRINDLKDYSNMLGPHGGWIDRIDSIIIPVLFLKN